MPLAARLGRALVIVVALLAARVDLASAASTGQIVGTVLNADTKAPIDGAKVSAVSPSGAYRTYTDEKGQFTIVGVVVDTYTIAVEVTGYQPYAVEGATVTADESYRFTAALHRNIRTIATARATRVTSAFQPQQTVDRYTVNAQGIDQLLGKSFNVDGTQLLKELPSVTVDKSGTPLIRGGFSFQTSSQVEGIDYTLPTRSLTNRFANSGNSNILNGIGSVEIIPGGGDATHGDTGTGLISYSIKRGTRPAFTNFDFETGLVGDVHQFAFEDGRTFGQNARLSNYISLISVDQAYQYGPYGTSATSIGASAITPDPNLNSNVLAHSGSLFTTAFFNTAAQNTRDFVDNLVYKFGKNGGQSLQAFYQSQSITEPENYGGYQVLTYPLVGQNSRDIGFAAEGSANPNAATLLARQVFAQYPGGVPGAPLTGPEIAYSPFQAMKLEYNNILDSSTYFALRFTRTLSTQQQYQPYQGLLSPDSGGTRTGVSTELTRQFGTKHSVQIGGKYEFAVPFGTTQDYIDYLSAYGSFTTNVGNLQNQTNNPVHVVDDFITPGPLAPGCTGTPFAPVFPATQLCGYLSHFFPGRVPQLPPEIEEPTAKQQSYGLFAQDTWSPSEPLKILLGLRLDGYNFLIPSDPQNPPGTDGIRHQRQYEPHLGLSYRLSRRDSIRANFGRTLAVPLPSFIGNNIDRAAFNAFNNIPSYDNTRGPFDPNRPNATQATYCGPGTPQIVGGTLLVLGTQPCTSYADQLYWLVRNYRFGLQNEITYPLRGATFTNIDFSYSHEFKDGTAFKMTPFYRRGYDVVETTRSLLGWDPVTGVANLTPEIYANLGVQHADGLEFDVTKFNDVGLSYQFTATYVNQIGNDPPGTYLPTASLQLGELYHAPTLAPFQASLGLTYRTRGGLKINPVETLRSGYPYGAGIYYAVDYNGQPVYVPLTDALVQAIGAGNYVGSISNAFVNPQNPGTITNPNIVSSRGTEALNSGPGSLYSKPSLQTDITIELSRQNTGLTYGFGITNLFDQTADVPTVNLARVLLPVSTGNYVNGGTLNNGNPTHSNNPTAVGSSTSPYIVYPNGSPLTLRLYVQAKL